MNELYEKPKSKETEEIIKSNVKNVEADAFFTLSGFRGELLGHEIYTTMVKFKDLDKLLTTFEDVQRGLNARKVNSIATYILSEIENKTKMRFFPSLTVSSRGHIFYDNTTKSIAIDVKKSKMSINDGQHRFFGINKTIEILRTRIGKSKTIETKRKNELLLNRVGEMVIPITIFNGLSVEQEKQLFYDLNSLAVRPSRTSAINLNQNNRIAKMTREIAQTNPDLQKWGVSLDKATINKKSKDMILLTTIFEATKYFMDNNHVKYPELLDDGMLEYYKLKVSERISKTLQQLPSDAHDKHKYFYYKSYVLRGIFDFYSRELVAGTEEHLILKAIGKLNVEYDEIYWKKYNGVKSNSGDIIFNGGNTGGMFMVRRALRDELEKIQDN